MTYNSCVKTNGQDTGYEGWVSIHQTCNPHGLIHLFHQIVNAGQGYKIDTLTV